MLKKVDHCYCDKCKKEIKEGEKKHRKFYSVYGYDLCENCINEFNEFYNKILNLQKQWEQLEKEYQYGEYLPKEGNNEK